MLLPHQSPCVSQQTRRRRHWAQPQSKYFDPFFCGSAPYGVKPVDQQLAVLTEKEIDYHDFHSERIASGSRCDDPLSFHDRAYHADGDIRGQ
jgi:hypothetical protein